MADYSKLADEMRARKLAREYDEDTTKSRELETLRAFLKDVELRSALEISEANQELHRQGLLTGEFRGGIALSRTPKSDTLLFKFGTRRECKVDLNAERYRLVVSMIGPDQAQDEPPFAMHFSLMLMGTHLKVFREATQAYPRKPTTEVQAKDVAEAVVSGLIRGSFD